MIISGTYLLCAVTRNKILLAADSRAIKNGVSRNDAVKILSCGQRAACAIAGVCEAEIESGKNAGESWSLYQCVAAIRQKPAGPASHRAEFIAEQIYDASASFFERFPHPVEGCEEFKLLYSEWSKDGTASVYKIRFQIESVVSSELSLRNN